MNAARDREMEASQAIRSSRRMSSSSVVASNRGGTDGNGAGGEERRRRKPSTARSQLQRVDEEGFYTSDVGHNGGLRSPVSSPSDFGSDEEVENHSRQGDRRRASTVSFSSRKSLATRDAASPRRSSLRPPLQCVPPSNLNIRRPSRLASPDYVAATLDEKKQKKLVALFYWRRKALETYLAAWKWVTFELWRLKNQDQHQRRELELLRPYASVVVRPVEKRPLHQSTLLRNAHERRQLDTLAGAVTTSGSADAPRDRIRSLREEYRQLKAVERQQAEPVAQAAQETETLSLKERLRIYYRCFEAWRAFLETARATEQEAVERAVKWHTQRIIRRHFRAWSKPFMVLQHAESLQWERVRMYGDALVLRRRFHVWRQWLTWSQSVKELQKSVDARYQIKAVSKWRAWVESTTRLHQAERKLLHRLKRRSFERMKLLRIQRKVKEQAQQQADRLRDTHVRKWAWGVWKRGVFHSDEAIRVGKLVSEVSSKLAIGKWKRFIARRRADHERDIQADSCLYEVLLRRCWVRWCGYLAWKRAKLSTLERAERHKETQDKRRAIRSWITLRCEAQYKRDQANGAACFYEQRLVQSFFQRWRVYARDIHAVREWRTQRVKRQFVLCFVAWRQHTQRLERLRTQFVTVDTNQRRRLLAESLCEWRYQWHLRVASGIVIGKRWHTVTQLHIHAWHQVSVQRQEWRRAIEHIRAKQTERLKRQLLVAWFGVAVRARCRSKLVRLFQRKHNRKKLKRCLRVFHLHAKLRHLHVLTQKRSLESVWHAWVVFVSDQQRKTEAMVAAYRFYSSRRCAKAVSTWSQNVKADRKERRNTHKALRFLISRVMRTTFEAWRLTTHTRRNHRELVHNQVRRHVDRRLRRCLRSWCVVARRRAKKRRVHQLLCRHLIHRLQQNCFAQWCAYARRRQESRQVLVATQRRLWWRRGRRVLQAWRIAAFGLRQKRKATQVIASQRRKKILQTVLRVWRVAAVQRELYCSNKSKAVAFHREYLLLWAFFGWQHASLASQVLKEKTRRAARAVVKRRLQQAVQVWRKALDKKHAQQLLAGRAVHFYRQRRRSMAVDVWRSFADMRAGSRRKHQIADDFANAKIIRRCLRSWIQFTSGTRAFKIKLRAVFQTGDEDIQRKAFRRWRRYKRSSTLRLRADAWQTRTRLASVWRHWRAQVEFSQKMKANVLVTSRLLQNNSLRTTFVQWTQFVARRHRHLDTLKRGEAFYTRRCLQLAIQRLHVQVRHARAVELSETFHAKHALRQSWAQWLSGVKYQQHWRQLKAFAISTYRRNSSRRVFISWRGLVEAKQQVLYLKADSFCNNLALRHVWRAWKRVVQCRLVVQKALRRREQRVAGGVLMQWREFTLEQQLIRRHVNAAVAHLDRVTMQKIWERWLVFLEQRREVHRAEARAQSFYSTRVLLTRTFDAWARFVEIRHKNHAQRIEAEVFFATSTTRKCFGQLKAYAEYRHQRAETIAMRDEAVDECRRRRAIAKWHARAGVLGRMRESLKQVASFSKQRRLSEAIGSLMINKANRKQRRQDRQRAVQLYRGRLIKTAFARWRAFLTWRRRNKHLLRLFRTNQLGDYFALWHKYVKRSQCKRQLQAKATCGYRQLLQRNAFARWQARCAYWQNMRRAVHWHASRQTRDVFAVWSHRVRVLRKMRLMFRFQESFRKETHFAAWRRRWWYKKQQVARVRDASKWFVRHRLTKCFALWIRWLEGKRQERNTLRMAVGFQRRFFSRKYLTAWHGVILWHRRKQELMRDAIRHDVLANYRRVWSHLRAYRSIKKRLRSITSEVFETLEILRAQRAVDQWKRRMNQRRAYQQRKELAMKLCDKRRLERSWKTLRRWLGVCKAKGALRKRADSHYGSSVCRRLLLAWSDYTRRMHQLRHGLARFKTQYFRSVADECFYEWKAVVHLKCELRRLKHRVQQSHDLRVLRAWRQHTRRARDMQRVVAHLQQRARSMLLQKCVSHWEVVAADRWMFANIVRIRLQRRERQTKQKAMERWKTLLTQRLARKQWRRQARQRNSELLRRLLQRWRDSAYGCYDEHGSDSEADQVKPQV